MKILEQRSLSTSLLPVDMLLKVKELAQSIDIIEDQSCPC